MEYKGGASNVSELNWLWFSFDLDFGIWLSKCCNFLFIHEY